MSPPGLALCDRMASAGYSRNNLVIFSSVNYGFRDMASNWLCSLDRLGIKNYILFAQDERVPGPHT